jgi:glucose/arabinose dehydrogenase
MRFLRLDMMLICGTCYFSWGQSPQLILEPVNQFWIQPLVRPVDIQNAGDERLFVVEQAGKIKIVDPVSGQVLPEPFLDISLQLGEIQSGSELGLLGLAFHPAYIKSGWFYINYTDLSGQTTIKRFTRSNSNPNLADPASGVTILTFPQPFLNNNGGCLRFGPDGYLYIATGDGGWANIQADPDNRAQNPNSIYGKILRINVNTNPYSIPPDNPLVEVPGCLEEIWALGLRNPWRFDFDPLNGDLWLGDVGNLELEEVNYVKYASTEGILNFGWRCYEASALYDTTGCSDYDAYTAPVFQYGNLGGFCGASVVGGQVYRGEQYPGMKGWYIAADFCSAQFYGLYPDVSGGFIQADIGKFGPTYNFCAFGRDYQGEMYVTGYVDNTIYRIKDKCAQYIQPAPTIELLDSTHLQTSDALAYQWYQNGLPIPAATQQQLQITATGQYFVAIADSSGCPSYSDTLNVQLPTSNTSTLYKPGFGISPNPSQRDQLFVQMPEDFKGEVQLRSLQGIKAPIKSILKHAQSWEVTLGFVPAGVYIVECHQGGQLLWTGKWIKL